MQRYQLDITLLTMRVTERPTQTFTLPAPILELVRTLVNRTVIELPGQPNLPPDVVLDTLGDVTAFLTLLTSDTNGHKLGLSTLMQRLVVKIINKTARDRNGQLINNLTGGQSGTNVVVGDKTTPKAVKS